MGRKAAPTIPLERQQEEEKHITPQKPIPVVLPQVALQDSAIGHSLEKSQSKVITGETGGEMLFRVHAQPTEEQKTNLSPEITNKTSLVELDLKIRQQSTDINMEELQKLEQQYSEARKRM